ncbi:MAG: helix-hairpin-helix domain-containing protein [Lachnospiraceae bacterium]|nr:helix-hairpin-helix domain-containing protein [Lachnospiraceae bacterium]
MNESIDFSETKMIEESTSDPRKNSMDLYVFVCGAVARPGVYGLSKEARVYEALEQAGGALEDAALEQLNLARVLMDEETIYVPRVGEESEFSPLADGGRDDGLVNLNTASKEELMTLPGIGESRAESILDYRKQVGKFQHIEDVMQVSGIKENAFAKIKELICV